jgi:hypothetical protein
MRSRSARVVFLLLMAAPCLGQNARVTVNANAALPPDTRPFGKYLVEICTISGEERTVTCRAVPHPPDSALPPERRDPNRTASRCPSPNEAACRLIAVTQETDQTVTLKLICDPSAKTPCDPKDPSVGEDFFVSATADSGELVQQTVINGSATPLGGTHTVQYRANAPGTIIIRATAPAIRISGTETLLYTESAPVDLILHVNGDSESATSTCAVLPPAPGMQSSPLDAPTIVSLLGNPTPFILAAQGSNTILIYSTRARLTNDEPRILGSFQQAIAELAGRTANSLNITPTSAKPFTVELNIPHAVALGDLTTRIGGLNYSQFTLQDVGRGRVRVTAPAQPDCDTWKSFLTDIREMAWQVVSAPMSSKLYYLSSSDVATAFTGPAAPGGGGTPSTATTTSTSSSPGPSTPAATPAATPSAGGSAPNGTVGSTPTATSAAPAAASANTTIAITQPPGTNVQINSDTTPCVIAGLATGNATACGGTPASAPAAGAPSTSSAAPGVPVAPAAPAPLAMASVSVAAGTGEQTPPDLLVFSDSNPGDDAQIEERTRVLAQLDLPRPEMILTAWVTQNSSASPQAMGAFGNMVKSMVADYNQEFEWVVLRGWEIVKTQIDQRNYFNEPFRSYIEDRFVADTYQPRKQGSSVQDLSQAFLDQSQAKLADPVGERRTDFGICESNRYCLGYSDLFKPLKPALTDLILTIIAAQLPNVVVDNAVAYVEGSAPPAMDETVCASTNNDVQRRCRAIWQNLVKYASLAPAPLNCADQDFRGILGSLLSQGDPRVHLRCFKQQADLLLGTDSGPGDVAPYGIGLIRAAIADFLFNYKISQQYPHEFASYDLSHSADALNNALSPLIDAFNRDLWSYQLFVRADMQYRVEQLNSLTDERCCVKRLFGLDKPSFFNDGLVTVRTISGQPTSVSTTSQSFLNGSTAPELSALLSSLAALSTPTASTTTTTPPAVPLGNFGVVAAALANYQTTFAQIGRQLSFSATPRSLNTASSAEIAVTLNADESAGGPLYTGGGANDPASNTSRVANHDTTTRVRVDSIKLFEVSSFTAIVERSRSRFPLLPPFVEIPYIGTFAGIPLGAAKEFHSSTAIISAYVVPTAADIAYGLRFSFDLAVDGLNPGPCSIYKGAAGPDVTNVCLFRRMLSMRDAPTQPIIEFNRRITRCFALDTTLDGCMNQTFDRTIQKK